MAWLIQSTWVWANSRRLWRTEKPCVLQSIESQRVGHSWVTEQQQWWEGFPGGASGKEHRCQCRRCKRLWFDPWFGKITWKRKWQRTLVFLPGESNGQRRLADYSPQGLKESNMIEHAWHTQWEEERETKKNVLPVCSFQMCSGSKHLGNKYFICILWISKLGLRNLTIF